MKFVINLLVLLACIQAKAETILRFQAHISPHARHLGDLLLISPDKAHWSKITLDSHPKNGETINKQKIIAWMQNKVGVFHYQWKGKNTAVIQEMTHSKAQDLLNKAQKALENQLRQQAYSSVTLNSKTLLKDSDIPLADFTVQIPKNYPTPKRVCVRLKAKNRSVAIWFSVKAYQSVLVAQHKLKQHTLIQQHDLVLQKRNIAGLPSPPLTQFPKTIWLNRSLNKNQILMSGDLSNQPEVIQGQKVKVNVLQHGISIYTEALAESDGYIGQMIRMKNPQTNKYFVATVTGKNQAEIAA